MSLDDRYFKTLFWALMPRGAIWAPVDAGELDKILDALAARTLAVAGDLDNLKNVRRPELTKFLDELEREFGVVFNPALTEEQRRANLLIAATQRGNIKTSDYLESILRGAGFDVYVHINNPPVDPAPFIFEAYAMYFGDEESFIFGEDTAYFGGIGGYLIVNGELAREISVYSMTFGSDYFIFGNSEAVFGEKYAIERDVVEYTIPTDPNYWGLFFFIGGPATRGPGGELIEIDTAFIPADRRAEFVRLVVQYKPLHSWAAAIVEFTET